MQRDLAGTRLGDVSIVARLAASTGASVVWRGRDTKLDREVAVKIVEHQSDVRLDKEVALVRRLEHPNIVRLYDFGVEDDFTWMAFELVNGVSLATRLDEGPLSQGKVLRLALELAEGLDYAHKNGVIHCDLTPRNVMLERQGISRERARILDFGIAASTVHDRGDGVQQIAGTPGYIAPEVILGLPPEPATDVYCLGLLVAEMIQGTPCVPAAEELSRKLERATTGELVLRAEHFGPELLEVVERAVEVNSFDRFPDISAFHEAIGALVGSSDLHVVVPPAPSRGRSRGRAAVAILLGSIVLFSLGTIALIKNASTPAPERSYDEVIADAERADRSFAERPAHAALHGGLAGATTPGVAPRGVPLRIAVAPYVDASVLRTDLAPILEVLGTELGSEVDLSIGESYAATSDALIEGAVDIAVLPPMAYVAARASEPRLRPVLFEEFDGSTSSDAYLVVDTEGVVSNLEAARGRPFCFSDPDSTTGYYLPTKWLRTQGHDPDAFIGEIVWTGDHLQSLRDLLAGRCAVAATYSGAYFAARDNDIPAGRLRILEVVGRSPQNAWVVGPEVSKTRTDAVVRALLDLDPTARFGQRAIGETLRITGFALASDADFDDLRDMPDSP